MMVVGMVPECDFDGIKFDAPVEGAWLVMPGATGRWCPVMYAGPDAAARLGYEVLSPAEAVARIEAQGGFPDF